MSQASWLNAQKREHLEATYQRMRQAASLHQMDTDGSEDRAISEFESPQQVLPQQYQHFQQGYFDNSSQNIDDASSDFSHPGY